MPAAKSLIAVEGRVVSEVIGPAGGWLQATEDGPRKRDKLEVRFVVLPKALDQAAFITMEVVGKGLSDLVIHFSPAGLLIITLGVPGFSRYSLP